MVKACNLASTAKNVSGVAKIPIPAPVRADQKKKKVF